MSLLQVVPPPDPENRDTVQRVLGAVVLDPAKLAALEEVLGVDLYFLLTVVAGTTVRFPKIDMLRSYIERAGVYDLVMARIEDGIEESEAIREVASEMGSGWSFSRVRKAYTSIQKLLQR